MCKIEFEEGTFKIESIEFNSEEVSEIKRSSSRFLGITESGIHLTDEPHGHDEVLKYLKRSYVESLLRSGMLVTDLTNYYINQGVRI